MRRIFRYLWDGLMVYPVFYQLCNDILFCSLYRYCMNGILGGDIVQRELHKRLNWNGNIQDIVPFCIMVFETNSFSNKFFCLQLRTPGRCTCMQWKGIANACYVMWDFYINCGRSWFWVTTLGHLPHALSPQASNGQVRLGVRYVIIFLYVFFLIRLAAVRYHGEKVRTVVCPAVISVNKSRDIRNCTQNGAEYTICVLFTARLYYKALEIILCTLICQIRRNCNRLDDDHCDVTGHRKMSPLGTAGAMVTTHENSLMMWSF